jgi:predicted nucleic acid-binding protein
MRTVTTPTGSKKFVVDSSGWIEYLGNAPKAGSFAPYLEDTENLLLPTVVVYEVCKKLLRTSENTLAEQFLSQAFSFNAREISIDIPVAALAAKISLELKLVTADAIIYACAKSRHAELVTADTHFQGLPGVILF